MFAALWRHPMKTVLFKFITPIFFTLLMAWFLWYPPMPFQFSAVWRYFIIAALSFLFLTQNTPRGTIRERFFNIPSTWNKIAFLISITAFILWYAGASKVPEMGWPLNLLNTNNFGGLFGAPLGEELLFRGYLFAAFSSIAFMRFRLIPNKFFPSLTVFLTALLFALWHIPLYPDRTIASALFPHFVFGFALGWIFEQTRSLPYVITIHMISNSFWC